MDTWQMGDGIWEGGPTEGGTLRILSRRPERSEEEAMGWFVNPIVIARSRFSSDEAT
jgi:hypothetical protein